MNREVLFKTLTKAKKADLLALLERAYDELSEDQRDAVFSNSRKKSKPTKVSGKHLLAEIDEFHADSFAEVYYAPFNVNSNNYMDVPTETKEWCSEMARFLQGATQLAKQGDHKNAVTCFERLYNLIEALGDGDDIIFADEVGSWMIPVDEKVHVKAYLTSLAVTASSEEFTQVAIPIIRHDSYYSFTTKAYEVAKKVANPEQIAHLDEEIKRQNIRTKPS